jgi:hypothetical protein
MVGSFKPRASNISLCPAVESNRGCTKPNCKLAHFFVPCDACNQAFASNVAYESHVKTQRHLDRLTSFRTSDTPQDVRNTSPDRFCQLCQIPVSDLGSHTKTQRHLRFLKFQELTSWVKETEKDKNGVGLDGKFDFGIVELEVARKGVGSKGHIRVRTASMSSRADGKIRLLEVTLSSSRSRQSKSG